MFTLLTPISISKTCIWCSADRRSPVADIVKRWRCGSEYKVESDKIVALDQSELCLTRMQQQRNGEHVEDIEYQDY